MKTVFNYTFIIPLLLICFNCQSQTQNKTTSVLSTKAAQKKNKLQPIPVMAENNTVIGGAFLLPEDWQGKATMQYITNVGLDPYPYIEMHNANYELKGGCFGSFVDSPQYRQTRQMMEQTAAQSGIQIPRDNTYFQPIQPIEQFTQQHIFKYIKPEYKPTQLTEVYDFFLKANNNQVLLTTFENTINPEKTVYLLTIYYINRYQDVVNWKPYAFSIEGLSSNKQYMLDVLRLVANSFQFNPIFMQYLNTINQQIAQGQSAAFDAQQSAIRGMQDHFFGTLHSIQKTSNRTFNSTSEQFSDMMLDVTTYKIPGMNDEVKLPSSNEYYYTNNLGDYIGTNNPLFDPNTDLTSIYNWQLLQSKY